VPGTQEPLNILAIAPLPFCSNGVRTFNLGASVFYAELLPRLARLGHTVRVIAEAPLAQNGQQRTGLSWDVFKLAVEWFAFEYHPGSGLASSFFPELEKAKLRQVFTRMVKAEKPDVVLLGREALALAQDPALRQRIGEKARAVAAAQTPERWAQAYAEVLQRTAAGRTGCP
jgi:hypothetical protein